MQKKPYLMHNRTPPPTWPLSPGEQSGPVTAVLLQTAGIQFSKKQRSFSSSLPHLLLHTYFQSQLTSQNKKWRDGRRWNTSLLHNTLVWQLLALTFEAMGTLLKEQMLTDVQAQEHGNYTSGWSRKKSAQTYDRKEQGGKGWGWQAHAEMCWV